MNCIRIVVTAAFVLGPPAFAAAQGGEFDPPLPPSAQPAQPTQPVPPMVSPASPVNESEQSSEQGSVTVTATASAPVSSPVAVSAGPSPTAQTGPPPSSSADQPTWSAAGEGRADADVVVPSESESTGKLLHGFRLGYAYMFQNPDFEGEGDLQRYGLESPHNFLIGYELFYRLIGHSWLNVLLVGNVIVAGLDQSRFLPSVNFLLGFEFDESFQVGLGMNLAPDDQKPTHMIVAAGWTPRVGNFYVPLHAFFLPDVDGFHRIGATVGVTL